MSYGEWSALMEVLWGFAAFILTVAGIVLILTRRGR